MHENIFMKLLIHFIVFIVVANGLFSQSFQSYHITYDNYVNDSILKSHSYISDSLIINELVTGPYLIHIETIDFRNKEVRNVCLNNKYVSLSDNKSYTSETDIRIHRDTLQFRWYHQTNSRNIDWEKCIRDFPGKADEKKYWRNVLRESPKKNIIFKFTGETKTIADCTCHQALLQIDDDSYEIWYYQPEDLRKIRVNEITIFSKITGIIMEENCNGILKRKATALGRNIWPGHDFRYFYL